MGRRRHPALLALLCLALAGAPLAGCQGEARNPVDCDQLLNERKYDDVIDHCDNPYQRASAYLGLAGFDVFVLLDSAADPGNVVAVLGLTAANIDSKRILINKAVSAVKKPKDGSQAFALLVASFLGFAVTVEQFLDNGASGAATALDYIFDPAEIAQALDPQINVPALLVAPPPTDYFTAVQGGTAYTLNCTADVSGNVCDDDPETLVYQDPTGAGILDTASPPAEALSKSSVLLAVAGLNAGYPVQILDLALPYGFGPAAQNGVTDFLGSGGVGGVFDIGLGAYLQYLRTADNALAEFGGSVPGQTAISEDINALVSQFDNGGLRASDGGACASGDAVATLLTASGVSGLENVYAAAAGTLGSPAPGSVPGGYYNSRNLVAETGVASAPAFSTFAAIPVGTAFAALNRYKVLYPKAAGLLGFDATQATARADEGFTAFVSEFENIPLILPALPTANDGQLNVIELLCSAE
jgi:hypothetical protein